MERHVSTSVPAPSPLHLGRMVIDVMRLSAYFLAGDPWWLENSVLSYYDMVDRIVLSYDSDKLSWAGSPLAGIDESIDRARAIDRDRKIVLSPGKYSYPDRHPLISDTYQRQCALDEAGAKADWVIQLDSDEVLQGGAGTFYDCLTEADERAAAGMDYPARWLYQRGQSVFLERSTRFWRFAAGYPGPVVVRAGTSLRHCRQADVPMFRVDFRRHNTDPSHPHDALVHRTIGSHEGILHFSWVRSEEYMRRKAGISGHSDNYSEPARLRRWMWSGKHPILTAAATPIRSVENRYRLSALPREYRRWQGE